MSENQQDNDPKWYVVHTYSGHENKVSQNLEKIVENRKLHDLICEIKVPTETVLETKDGKKREIERKIFPSYVLVKMVLTDDSWYVVRNTRGVTGFVGPASKPVPLTDDEVRNLGVDVKVIEIDYEVGDAVRVISGPFDSFVGKVVEIDKDNNKVVVFVSMFGRDTRAELELLQVERV